MTLAEEVEKYLAAVDEFRALGAEPIWEQEDYEVPNNAALVERIRAYSMKGGGPS